MCPADWKAKTVHLRRNTGSTLTPRGGKGAPTIRPKAFAVPSHKAHARPNRTNGRERDSWWHPHQSEAAAAVSPEGARRRPDRGVEGQGAKRRSKGPRSASDEGEEDSETERSDSLRGDRRGVGWADHRPRFRPSAARVETQSCATSPYALFLSPSDPELVEGFEVIFADVSGKNDGSTPSGTTANTVGTLAWWWYR